MSRCTTFAEASELLAKVFPGRYEHRPQQVLMANAIEILIAQAREALDADEDPPWLLVQAGCGTGKTYGMAIPAYQSGLRVVISTGTIALQQQLYRKDLPFLAEHLPDFPKFALLMGKSNYACWAKIEENPGVEGLPRLRAELELPGAEGTRETLSLKMAPEDWAQVSSTSAECPGAASCPFAEKCFSEKARADASDADLVVVNHALLGLDAEMRRKTEGAVSILGRIDLLLVDEADALDDALRGVLSDRVTQRGLMNLASAAETFVKVHGSLDTDSLPESIALVKAAEAFGGALPRTEPERREDAPEGGTLPLEWFAGNVDAVMGLITALDAMAARIRRVETNGPKETNRRRMLRAQAVNASATLIAAIRAEDTEMVRFNTWFKHPKTGHLFWTAEFCPVDISERVREGLWSRYPTVLTSATLTTAPDDYSFIIRTLGLEGASTLDVGTPFDYHRQSVLFVPDRTDPDPTDRLAWMTYVATTTRALVASTAAAGGGSLLLYTSRTAMIAAHQVLAPIFEAMGLTVLIQDGKTPIPEMADIFRKDTTSVWFGMRSLFVGLDVPGDALKLVVIDKLPFPAFAEPVYAARAQAEWAAQPPRDPFQSLSIPMMTLYCRQGVGRLIRTSDDFGAVAILDSRLTSKPYGPRILSGLPSCRTTSDLAEIDAFLAGRLSLAT